MSMSVGGAPLAFAALLALALVSPPGARALWEQPGKGAQSYAAGSSGNRTMLDSAAEPTGVIKIQGLSKNASGVEDQVQLSAKKRKRKSMSREQQAAMDLSQDAKALSEVDSDSHSTGEDSDAGPAEKEIFGARHEEVDHGDFLPSNNSGSASGGPEPHTPNNPIPTPNFGEDQMNEPGGDSALEQDLKEVEEETEARIADLVNKTEEANKEHQEELEKEEEAADKAPINNSSDTKSPDEIDEWMDSQSPDGFTVDESADEMVHDAMNSEEAKEGAEGHIGHELLESDTNTDVENIKKAIDSMDDGESSARSAMQENAALLRVNRAREREAAMERAYQARIAPSLLETGSSEQGAPAASDEPAKKAKAANVLPEQPEKRHVNKKNLGVHVSSLEEAEVTPRSIHHDPEYKVGTEMAKAKLSARLKKRKASREAQEAAAKKRGDTVPEVGVPSDSVHPSAAAGFQQARDILHGIDAMENYKNKMGEMIKEHNGSVAELEASIKNKQQKRAEKAQKKMKSDKRKLDGVHDFFCDAFGYKLLGSSAAALDTDLLYTNKHRTLREALGRCNEMRDAHSKDPSKFKGCKGVVGSDKLTQFRLVKQIKSDKAPISVPESHLSAEAQQGLPHTKIWGADDVIRAHGRPLLSAIENLDKKIDGHRKKMGTKGFVNKMLARTPVGHANRLLKAGRGMSGMLGNM